MLLISKSIALTIFVSPLLLASIAFSIQVSSKSPSSIQELKKVLAQSDDQVVLAKLKVSIDRMVNPSIQIGKVLDQIDRMVTDVQNMVHPNAPSSARLLALQKYLYTKGPWNNFTAFKYDFDDPMGTKIENKLLSQYIEGKKGNCISMPLLFIILGERLGLKVTASTAPLHIFVKFTEDETGRTYNLEATNGALPTRDEWYRKEMAMTDQAVQNGIYLQALTKKETAAVIVSLLGEYYLQEREYEKAIEVFELVLDYYPKYVYAMLKAGSSYYGLMDRHFFRKYSHPSQIPLNERGQLKFYGRRNRDYFVKAESLGWREPSKSSEQQYRDRVNKHR